MSANPQVQLVLDCHTDLGESPVWDERTGRLYFVDINEKRIHVYTPETKDHFTIEAPSTVGCVVPTNDPNLLLAALGSNVVEVNVEKRKAGRIVAFVSTDDNAEGTRFNDGKATPQGVFIVGRMNRAWRDGQPGKLFAMDLRVPGNTFGLLTILGPTEVCCPNGMDWDQDKGLFYFIDTADSVVRSYPVDENGVPKRSQDGVLVGVKDVVTAEEGIVLDGMTIDSKGNLWIAHGEGSAIVCYNPTTGKELQRVELPVKRPTSCTFGGKDLKTLYITTRHEGRHLEKGEEASENWGGLFSVEIEGVKGARAALYVDVNNKK